MSRTGDVKIALWAGMANSGLNREHAESVLNALLLERDRADKAERLAERRQLARDIRLAGTVNAVTWLKGESKRCRRLTGTLWKSRRMWQEEARKYFRFFLAECKVAESERERADKAEKTIARVRQFAHEMRGYCSPMGISMHYASQLEDVLDGGK